MWAAAVQAGMERGTGNPCGKRDGIHLSLVSTAGIKRQKGNFTVIINVQIAVHLLFFIPMQI
jgi:hypothetical protein